MEIPSFVVRRGWRRGANSAVASRARNAAFGGTRRWSTRTSIFAPASPAAPALGWRPRLGGGPTRPGPGPRPGGRTRRRRGPSRAVGLERLLRPPARHVGALGEERRRLGHGALAAVGRGGGADGVEDRRRVDHADGPGVLLGQRGPVRVESPAPAKLGERQE